MGDNKRSNGSGDGGGGMERLPNSIINEILVKLDLESLCSAACVCRTLRFSVSQALSSFSSLDLSAFSPDAQTLNHIISGFTGLKTVTVDCLRLDDYSVINFLGAHIEELSLLKSSSLSSRVLASIGQRCPNLRVILLELAGSDLPEVFERNLIQMLKSCSRLESVCIKIRGSELGGNGFHAIGPFLPKTVKVLKLQQVLKGDAIHFIHELRDCKNFPETLTSSGIHFTSFPPISLQHLSLVLDVLSDELIITIVNSLPLLVELNLEDRPSKEPLLPHDLTNNGLQSLSSCRRLTSLSVARGRQNHVTSFKRVNDLGMFLLSEGCKSLESVILGGFSTVSDAGFSAIMQSSPNLKKFEVHNALLLSDLAFHDMTGASSSLVELRLLSCGLITSEALEELSSSSMLEVLDLYGCRSIADSCLDYVSGLHTLSTLNLGGADVTDEGLAILGGGKTQIKRLNLRGCKRITDKGIAHLFHAEGTICKSLTSLDLGYMPGISDRSIATIAMSAEGLTELCIRYCFFVTDASLEMLASERRSYGDGLKVLLRRLDVYHCLGLSVESVGLLKKPLFRGLKWVGVGLTRLASERAAFVEICEERPWLTVCFDGCEAGCHDGWQFHV